MVTLGQHSHRTTLGRVSIPIHLQCHGVNFSCFHDLPGPCQNLSYEAPALDGPTPASSPATQSEGWEGAPEPLGLPAETSEVSRTSRGTHSQVPERLICSPTSWGWFPTATLVMPGRSRKVRSGTSGEVISRLMSSWLMPTPFPATASWATEPERRKTESPNEQPNLAEAVNPVGGYIFHLYLGTALM